MEIGLLWFLSLLLSMLSLRLSVRAPLNAEGDFINFLQINFDSWLLFKHKLVFRSSLNATTSTRIFSKLFVPFSR